jgi:DSF synthase
MITAPASNVTHIDVVTREYEQLATYFDRKYQLAWAYMRPTPRACFTPQLLADLNDWFRFLGKSANHHGIKYHVITGADDKVFNLGGDLDLFRRLSERGDRNGLAQYATACIDALYANLTDFGQDVTTLSLVRGSALGGGFEAALSSDVIIAERGAQLGFPEVLFNLFPGMGAYSFLARKLGPKQAEQIILSGNIYSAEELHDMGLIDELAEPGTGEQAIYSYIKRENRARNGIRALRKVRDYCSPISRRELDDIVGIWVDAAMRLNARDLRMMERLVNRQSQQHAAAQAC